MTSELRRRVREWLMQNTRHYATSAALAEGADEVFCLLAGSEEENETYWLWTDAVVAKHGGSFDGR